MKILISTAFIFLSLSIFSQIDPNLSKPTWAIGKEKTINGNRITRIEGKNDIAGATNSGYETITQLLAEVENMANNQMWSPEKKESTIKSYETLAGGGAISLYITRLTIDAANTDMFTIIIKDSTDNNEILRQELDSDIPQVPSTGSNYWWNYTTVTIPEKIEGKFYVYVIDKLGRENSKFKFEVNY